MNKEDFYWYWLNNIPEIGRVTIRKLLDYFGSPERVYNAKEAEIVPFLQKESQRMSFFASKSEGTIHDKYKTILDKGIQFIHPESNEYPERLCNIPDAPTGLYLKGHFHPEYQKSVAIIGTRHCTRYGSEMARFFGRELAKCGVSVVSGLARGIDGMAHAGALEAKGYTLGILGCGIDRVYPVENYQLYMQMEESGGILSEYNIGIAPAAGLFPQRNRLIAGMADCILVVEAMEKSGTFITVDQGLEQGKDIFAIPGRIMDSKSVGCNNLIKIGAHMVTEVDDILEILDLRDQKPSKLNDPDGVIKTVNKMSLAPVEKMVYSCLRIEPQYLDDIIEKVRIAPQEVCMVLNRLVLLGIVAETTRNYYAIQL